MSEVKVVIVASDTPPPMIAIEWEDAKLLNDEGGAWVTNKKREYVPHIVRQVGFLLLQNEQGIHMTYSWHPELIAPVDQIPAGMIRSITYLQPIPQPEPKPIPQKRKRNART